jgi:hypothetical protein
MRRRSELKTKLVLLPNNRLSKKLFRKIAMLPNLQNSLGQLRI